MNILLVGFYGEGNLGDNAILSSIIRNIPDKHKIFITSGKRASSARGFTIKRRGIASWIPFIHYVKQSSHTIFSGGILQDWSFDGVAFFALRILAAKMANSRVSLWGTGLGPIKRKGLITLAKRALRRVDCAWLRDKESQAFFKSLTGKSANLGTDWSWGTDVVREINNSKKYTGINLREWKNYSFTKLVKKELNLSSNELMGIAARKYDACAIKSLSHKIRVIIPEDFENLLLICNQLKSGIAMRYHVALAMIRTGVPVKLISYDDKVTNLANDANVDVVSEGKSHYKVADQLFLDDNYKRFETMRSSFLSYLSQAF